MTSDLETSYRHCRAVVRSASSNLASTFWLLPTAQRRGMDALYAFARQADDLVDNDEPLEARRAKLEQFREAVRARLAPYLTTATPFSSPTSYELTGPLSLLPAIEDTVRRFGIPADRLLELLDGVEMDLQRSSYQTFDELYDYCYRVASAMGLSCLPIWGCRDDGAHQPAIDCGIAFQLTNIIRDIREDAGRGRIYLPAEEMARFGLSPDAIATGAIEPEWKEFLDFQIARAESFFESGEVTGRYLPPPGRRVFHLMLARYRAILAEAKCRGGRAVQERAWLSYPRKLLIAAGALLKSQQKSAAPVARAKSTGRKPPSSVVIIGGGLAGLSAATALCERGIKVELFEAKRRLGGRAGSYVDKEAGAAIDHCQHVAMGCCTNFLDFCRRTKILALFERHETLYFFGPDGQRCDFRPSTWLPAPLHLAAAFRGLRYLSRGEQRSIALALMRLARLPAKEQPNYPTIGEWLRQQKQSTPCIERFWHVVLVSALGESLDRASLAAARKVFVDGFLSSHAASHMFVPKVPLAELYEHVLQWLVRRGVKIHLGAPVERVEGMPGAAMCIRLKDGGIMTAESVVAAVPWRQAGEILPLSVRSELPAIQSAPITSLHLWFDRPIMELPHAVLVGRLSQWVFAKDQESGVRGRGAAANYYQVVISASHELGGRDRQDVLREVRSDLEAVFPLARSAALLRWQMITEQEAVFSVRPGLEQVRPTQVTCVSNLFLAGDWTATSWPSTMESAVRSGYLAAEAVLCAAGRENRILIPELRRGVLSRLILKG